MSNRIVDENAITEGRAPQSYWDVPHSNAIEGFATDISVNAGNRVDFKINVNDGAGTDYKVEIFRLGYYGGDGAREVAEWTNGNAVKQDLPLYDQDRGLVDAGNWTVTDSWVVPAAAVSGVYLARIQRLDANGDPIPGEANQIPFIVRNDGLEADIVLQTSDTTWQAYNGWHGGLGDENPSGPNFYGDNSGLVDHDPIPNSGSFAQDRAYAVSYNRPLITRGIEGQQGGPAAGAQDYLFGADYAAIHWLEQNGYDVSYIAGVDTDRLGPDYLKNYNAFISVGHDEYWSGEQRWNVEEARDSGVNILFWSGNEVYWKTRWETSISADGTAHRTLVCYKETWANGDPNAGPEDYNDIDPTNIWTGTWRDTRFIEAQDENGDYIAGGADPDPISGLRPFCNCAENSLTGQLFGPDSTGESGSLDVPAPFAGLRFWRNTDVANGGALDLAPGILGYEWNTSPEDDLRPAGLIKLSDTTIPWGSILTDQGNQVAPGVATHNLSLYRAESGALVFGAGTVFWSWALSDLHDGSPYDAQIANRDIQQFTINMFADMGIQPGVSDAILQSQGLVRALASTDFAAATTAINDLPDETPALGSIVITGTATDNDGNPVTADGKVAVVEVSVDGGVTWKVATTNDGWATWSYDWRPTQEGTYTIKARAIDDSLNVVNVTPDEETITVTAPIPPDTFSLFDPSAAVSGTVVNESTPLELGMRFKADRAGEITELKYYRSTADAGDTDARQGHLWTSDGQLLATVTFTSAPGAIGWQVATLTNPVAIQPGVEYVVSYRTNNNYFATSGFFDPANEVSFDGVDDGAFTDLFGVLSAPQNTVVNGNGLYKYGSAVVMPDETYQSANYWVDVAFDPAEAGQNTPPAITSNGGGPIAAVNVTENTTLVTTFSASDADVPQQTLSFTLTGEDRNLFQITGNQIHFVTAPDFEAPPAQGATSGYQVTLQVSDGNGGTDTQAITVALTDVNENAPGTVSLFDPSAAVSGTVVNDGTPLELGMRFKADRAGEITELKYYRSAADAGDTDVRQGHLWSADGQLLATATFTSAPGVNGWQVATLATPVEIQPGVEYIVSYRTNDNYFATSGFFDPANEVSFDGIDDDAFSDASGVLSAPQNTVINGSGLYKYGTALVMPDETYQSANYWVDVAFDPAENTSPTITSNGGGSTATVNVAENTTLVTTFSASDADVPQQSLSFTLTGEDRDLFQITGNQIHFVTAPDFEAPPAQGATSGYQVTLQVSDGNGGTDTQAITVALTDVNENAPGTVSLFDPSAAVSGTVVNDGTPLELGMRFKADRAGEITELKYYRSAADAGDTDVRQGHLWSADGQLLATATFTSAPGVNGWQVATLATPVEIQPGVEYVVSYRTNNNYFATSGFFDPANEISFDGIDNDAFTDASGVLSAPQNTVVNGNGLYKYGSAVVMPDETYRSANYWVDVAFDPAENTSPTITSNGGGSAVTINVAENTTLVTTFSASDADVPQQTLSFTLTGEDRNLFQITGNQIHFVTAPDFEAPPAQGATSGYQVTLQVSDGNGGTDTQAITVALTDVNENAPGTVSLFDPSAAVSGTVFNDGTPLELGMRFKADRAGEITELKYYRSAADAGDTDVREGHLWSADGQPLATVTFTSAPGAIGWQVATLTTPVAIQPGVEYVVSYRTTNNYFATSGFFDPANEVSFDGVDDDAFSDASGVLSAPQNTVVTGNGLYKYGTAVVMPDETYRSANYWVDVTFKHDFIF